MGHLTVPLALVLATLAACQEVPAAPPEPPWVVTIEAVQGEGAPEALQRCAADGADCRALAAGATLSPPGRLVTARGARAAVRLDASTSLAVGEDTVVVLPDSRARTVAVERGHCSLEQARDGAALELLVAGSQVELAGGQPTTVAIRASSAREATVTVHRGPVELVGDGHDPATVEPGRTVTLTAGGPPDLVASLAGRAAPVPRVRASEPAPAAAADAPRGFGRLTARVPGTEQVVSGVRLSRHHVRTTIHDGLARTEVEEELANDTERVLEGRYVFALPPGASLSRLALWVGDELVEGEIVERARAARIFRGIVDDTVRPRDPALLEWIGGGELSLKIFPIEPRLRRRVLLAYDEALPVEGRTLRYRYPLSLGRDRTTPIDEFSLTITADDARGSLRELATPGYAAVVSARDGGTTVALSARAFAPQEDFVLEYRVPEGDAPALLHLPAIAAASGAAKPAERGDEGAYFALPLTVGPSPGEAPPALTARDRVIVLDRSFSQGAESLAAELEIAGALLEDLGPDERFAVLACDTACAAHPERGLAAGGAASVAAARAWLGSAAPSRGASDLAGAVLAGAARLEANGRGQLVVLGDGRATAGELGAAAIAARIRLVVAERRADLRLLGVGRSLDEGVLAHVAAFAGAAYDRIATATSLEERIEALVLELRTPVVEAPALELPAGATDVEPARLPNLRLGQPLLVTGKLARGASGAITLRGTLAGRPFRLARDLDARGRASRSPVVPRLWAERRIAELEAQGTDGASAEAIALSRQHHVLSRHTSLLVLENDRMFAEFGIQRTQRAGASGVTSAPSSYGVWGQELGDDVGAGGLGLTGVGAGAGSAGIGLGALDVPGRAAGPGAGAGGGFGGGNGRLGGSHRTRAPELRMGATTVSGRLPPEVIQRIVRQNYGRFRQCYEQGLGRDPELAGRVAVRFVIGRDGTVVNVADGGSDLPDRSVVDCVSRAYYSLSFPQPEGGIVTVVYPIVFSPDRGAGERVKHAAPPTSLPVSAAGGAAVVPHGTVPWRAPAPFPAAAPVGWRFAPPVLHRPGTEAWRGLGESAITRARAATVEHPESRRAFGDLMMTLLRHGRFDDAHREGLELTRRDPDDAAAHERLAWAAAARGAGAEAATELSAAVEVSPGRASAQIAAARAFEAANDEPRACAHWRAAASLEQAPGRARREALRCRARLGELDAVRRELAATAADDALERLRAALATGAAPAFDPTDDAPGWFEARLECTAAPSRCPIPVVVTPRGRVVSPWTPELGRASAARVALTRASGGCYRTLLVGGAPGAEGKLTLVVDGTPYVRSFTHDGSVTTVVETDVNEG